jgi:hypothetical protein
MGEHRTEACVTSSDRVTDPRSAHDRVIYLTCIEEKHRRIETNRGRPLHTSARFRDVEFS